MQGNTAAVMRMIRTLSLLCLLLGAAQVEGASDEAMPAHSDEARRPYDLLPPYDLLLEM